MDGARDEFLAGASLSRDEHGGICGSHAGDPGKSGLQRLRGTDNLLEHEGSVDLVAQRQIFPIELILERPDLCFVSLSFAEIERERDAVVPSCVKQRTANQHGDATAIFPEELLLVGLNRPRRP